MYFICLSLFIDVSLCDSIVSYVHNIKGWFFCFYATMLTSGPHFNPLNRVHGAPNEEERHAGDLGNILAGSDGRVFVPSSKYMFCALRIDASIFG